MKQHWPLAILAAVSLALVLTNLGSDYLWEDEGDTAVLAANILKFGVPKAWDGVTFIDSDKGRRENSELVMVSHPWVQYYLAAGSFFLFGENTFAARLPFALSGWMSILLVYALVWRRTHERWAAFCAATLLVSSVQFLLYARQCRNYSINIFFTCWLIWTFFRMRSIGSSALFAVAAIVLFHTHPVGIIPVAVLGMLTLIYRPLARQRRWFWLALPAILVLTLPWLLIAHESYGEITNPTESIGQFFTRFLQFVIELTSVTPLIGAIVLLLAVTIIWKCGSKKAPVPQEKLLPADVSALLIVIAAMLVCYAIALAITQSRQALWSAIGMRYTPAALPFVAMMSGILIAKLSRGRVVAAVCLLLIFAFTKLPTLTPWLFFNRSEQLRVGAHAPMRSIDYFLTREDLLFLADLQQKNPGTVTRICEFLRQHAKPGDLLITNYSWEPLYFHTQLPQGMKILRDYPVYDAARRKGLPEYVFGIRRARWVVWRSFWEGYQGYVADEVRREILEHGGTEQKVAELQESVWENRENIHFRRFCGGKYLFLRPKQLPAAVIFRIDWPDDRSFRNGER